MKVKKKRMPRKFKVIAEIIEELKRMGKEVSSNSIMNYATTVMVSREPYLFKVDIGRCSKVKPTLISRYLREYYNDSL